MNLTHRKELKAPFTRMGRAIKFRAQEPYGFTSLDYAGICRRTAMIYPRTREFERKVWLRRAVEALAWSVESRSMQGVPLP